MTPAQIRNIVSLARFSPSGDNCQPFSFEWTQGNLLVLHDSATARSHMNPRNRASILALGCLIEILEIAALAEGFRTEVTYSIEDVPAPGFVRWASLRFFPCHAFRSPLLSVIESRSTDRRIYQGGDPSHPVFARLLEETTPDAPARLSFLSTFPDALIEYILDCDAFLWRDRKAVTSLLEWVHFDRKRAAETRSGMHWTNLGVGFADSLALRAIQRNPFWAGVFGPLGGRSSTRRVLHKQLRSSVALGCITIKGYGFQDLVAAGRGYLRAWLTLNAEGYAFQPVSLPLFFPAFLHEGIWETPMPAGFRELFLRGPDVFRKAFGLAEGEIPIWAFRTGRNPPLPASMRTFRKEVSELLTLRD